MATSSVHQGISRVLILGHSLVCILRTDLLERMFDLQGIADINIYGVGVWTIPRLRKFDLWVILKISPSIVSLETGKNGLANTPHEVVGSEIEYLVKLLISQYLVRAILVCQVTPHVTPQSSHFRERAKLLNQYTCS